MKMHYSLFASQVRDYDPSPLSKKELIRHIVRLSRSTQELEMNRGTCPEIELCLRAVKYASKRAYQEAMRKYSA
ncbi:hypothetical protein KW805_00070 [Candidatus Pacearchaeota archaeon]|nr:hypothetical protein [Candidatus Pacearchaeota archaeon]